MKTKELREKNIEELKAMADELKATVNGSRMELSMNKSNKTHLVSNSKRDLARILTVIREKELSE